MSMIGGPKSASRPSVNSYRSVSTESQQKEAGWKRSPQNIQEALSNNPVLRSLQGESGFDGVSRTGSAQAGALQGAERPRPEEMISRLTDAIQQLVSTLETSLAQQAGSTDASSEAASDTSGTQQASATDGTDATEDAASTDESQSPIEQLLESLKQVLGMLQQFQ
jgi:hypothetical protein